MKKIIILISILFSITTFAETKACMLYAAVVNLDNSPVVFTEKQLVKRKAYLDKVEVVMKHYNFEYTRNSSTQLCVFSNLSKIDRTLIENTIKYHFESL